MICHMSKDGPSIAPRLAVVVSRYNASVTDALLQGALDAFSERFPGAGLPDVYRAPGAYELPVLAHAAAKSGRYQGVVALGCLIKGETRHDRYIADAVSHGLMRISLDLALPVTFGVLTTDTPKQARARAGGSKGNKGHDAMSAALDTIAEASAIADSRASVAAPAVPDKTKSPRSGKKEKAR